jgi:acyl dehydratase
MPFERKYTCNDLMKMKGSELGVSEWLTVKQELIDGFGEATKDDDWLHLDPERTARETPFGGTIAFGFWTLSMLTHFSHEIGMWPSDIGYGLNYGLDRVRWTSPVPVGSRIRNRCVLIRFDERDEGQFLIRTSNTIEIEGKDRPALLAEWLGLFVRSTG